MLHRRMTGKPVRLNTATDECMIRRLLVIINHPHSSVGAFDFRRDGTTARRKGATDMNNTFQPVLFLVCQRSAERAPDTIASVHCDFPRFLYILAHRITPLNARRG